MINEEQVIALLGIGTAVPSHRVDQNEAAERIMAALEHNPSSARWAKRIFRQVGVETRYTCESSLADPEKSCRYLPDTPRDLIPKTAERMDSYRAHSIPLGLEAAQKALQDSGVPESDITHLMAVSCTGMFLPGLDVMLLKELGLAADTKRIPLTFLGCAAGLTAIRLAKDIVEADPEAKVLIVCVELCTLHFQPTGEKEALFGAAFFGDGASSCVVGRSSGQNSKGLFALGEGRTVVFPDSAEDMVWTVGDYGFDLYLSPAIPKLIGQFLPPELERLWLGGETAKTPAKEGYPELWAIHPGGRGIIDILQEIYGLEDKQTEPSRTVLNHYGNMSSATILFVLQEMRSQLAGKGEADIRSRSGMAVAFGPGLHAEMINLTYVPAVALGTGEVHYAEA